MEVEELKGKVREREEIEGRKLCHSRTWKERRGKEEEEK